MRVRGGIALVVALLWCGSAAAAPPTPDPAPVPASPPPVAPAESPPPPPPVTPTTQATAPPPAVTQPAHKPRHKHALGSAQVGVAASYHAPPRGEQRPRHTRIPPVQAARYSAQGSAEQGPFGRTAMVLVLFGVAASVLIAFAALPGHILATLPSQLGAARSELILGGFIVLVAVLVGISIPLFLQ